MREFENLIKMSSVLIVIFAALLVWFTVSLNMENMPQLVTVLAIIMAIVSVISAIITFLKKNF